MNSCLYKATVMHQRLAPKPHRFHYNVFMFYIDLDEIGLLNERFRMLSHNRLNFYSFRDDEHLQLPIDHPDKTKTIKQQITTYLRLNGIDHENMKIMLLTNLNVLGYNFNPVSFYFCFTQNGEIISCIAEISNTFREMKPFFIGTEFLSGNRFHCRIKKYFYVSPFIDHDTALDFDLCIPDDKLKIKIDDYKDEKRFFISTLSGSKRALTNSNLVKYFLTFPFITLKVITLIHWNALLLWLKKLPYNSKAANQHLQQNVYRKYKPKG
jgi:DUF1365 family protein